MLLLWKLRCFLPRATITHFPRLWCNSCVTQPLIFAPAADDEALLQRHTRVLSSSAQAPQTALLLETPVQNFRTTTCDFVHQDVTAKTTAASRTSTPQSINSWKTQLSQNGRHAIKDKASTQECKPPPPPVGERFQRCEREWMHTQRFGYGANRHA